MNKKLLKSIICVASSVGVVTSIPFAATSCGTTYVGILPDNVYDIDKTTNILEGFTESFLSNPNPYKLCNTMQIPASVKSIANSAFSSSKNIPSFITNLTFAENSNCSSIGIEAFNVFSSLISINFSNAIKLSTIDQYCFFGCSSLTSVSFPSSLKTIDFGCFGNCSALNNIIWNLPDDYQTSITFGENAFLGISNSGTVTSLNEKITSKQLLSWIKQKGNFPASDGWKAAN